MRQRLFNLRAVSLPRGNLLVATSFLAAILISHPPELRPTLWMILPMLTAMWGSAETARCLQRRWNWYHGGVLLLLYADLMASTLIVFFLLFPYFQMNERIR